MQGIRAEHRHHSDEQIREALAFARDLVADLGVPDDLRVPAFERAVDLYAAKSVAVEQVVSGLPVMAIPRGV